MQNFRKGDIVRLPDGKVDVIFDVVGNWAAFRGPLSFAEPLVATPVADNAMTALRYLKLLFRPPPGQEGQWLPWSGGANPVAGAVVDLALSPDDLYVSVVWGCNSQSCHWGDNPANGTTIIAYRVVRDSRLESPPLRRKAIEAQAPGFFVWQPETGKPTVSHADADAAYYEARRLSEANPGKRFYVMAACGYHFTPKAEEAGWVELPPVRRDDLEIPF